MNEQNAMEILYPNSDKTDASLMATPLVLIGIFCFFAPYVLPTTDKSPLAAWSLGLFFIAMGAMCFPIFFAKFRYRADGNELNFHSGQRMRRIAWDEVVSFYVPPPSWYPSRPRCIHPPVLMGAHGKVLFLGVRYKVQEKDFAQHAAFWQFVREQLEGKEKPAPKLTSPQRVWRRQTNRIRLRWHDSRPSQKIICVVLGTVLVFGWLLLWQLGVNSLGLPRDDASMLNSFLMPFILVGPFFTYGIWRHLSIARAYQRKVRRKANRQR